jgi:hypothetical protein
MTNPFDASLAIAGELRKPHQMLAAQTYDNHLSIHDDKMAENLGFRAGPIEGPTHFSQFQPLLHRIFGNAWFETGCISAHYQNMVVEGEEVRAFAKLPAEGGRTTTIWAEKRDGTPVLMGTASIGPDHGETEIQRRIAGLRPPAQLVILADVRLGQKGANAESVTMGFDQHMGNSYPFSLADKLKVITEPCAWYTAEGGKTSPWGRPVIPMEMLSVLFEYTAGRAGFRTRGPAIGLFAGQEIKLVKGPLFVGETYDLEREVIALSESKRTESMWVRTRAFAKGELVAEMILNSATLKDSYAKYAEEAKALAKG